MLTGTTRRDHSERLFQYSLIVIVLAGFFLRLKGLASESLTADEASALLRLQFPTFSEMIEGGVRPDGHPAFTQILLWFWIKIFGNSEFAVRLPFALMGGASVYFTAKAAQHLFGKGTAAATAVAMAFLQFPLMYSQLARPYAPGLFFTAVSMWTVSMLMHEQCKRKIMMLSLFAVSSALAAYTHYFSLLTALLIGMAGVLLVHPTIRKKYLLSCLAAMILFLPHLSITFSQLKTGGVGGPGGWLGKPDLSFFTAHFFFAFDASRVVAGFAVLLFLTSIIMFYKKPGRKHIIIILLALIPAITGYWYSHLNNPVLQDSVLLFSFPFLLMFLFAWIPDPVQFRSSLYTLLLMLLVFGGYVTVYKPFHLMNHFGRLRELVTLEMEFERTHTGTTTTVFYNVDAPYFVEYYFEKEKYRPSGLKGTINNGFSELNDFRRMVEESRSEFFIYGWSTKYSPIEALAIIRDKYPCIVEEHHWYNSALYVFSSSPKAQKCIQTTLHEQIKDIGNMSDDQIPFGADTISKDIRCVNLDASYMYSPVIEMSVGKMITHPDQQLVLDATLSRTDSTSNAVLVVVFYRDGKPIQERWFGMESQSQHLKIRQNEHIYLGVPVFSNIRQSDLIRAYVFYKSGAPSQLSQLRLVSQKGHPGIYGPRPQLLP